MHTPSVVPAPATSRDADRIREFLTSHAALCPYCRYPLFRLRNDRCPECGGALALGIVTSTHDPRSIPLYLPPACNIPLGLIGAAFATFVRGEHDDWQVGVTIVVVSAAVAAPLWVCRRSIGSMRGGQVLFGMLWITSIVAAGLSFFLDI